MTNFSFFDFEQLRQLPRPRIDRASGHAAAVRRFECAVLPQRVIEKGEAEDETAFGVHGDESAIVNPPDEMNQTGFELLLAAPVRGV